MMVTLLLYAYCSGVLSSRKIQARCGVDVAFRVIVGEDIPDFRTISDFRKDNLDHVQSLFATFPISARSASFGVGIWMSSGICLARCCGCVIFYRSSGNGL